MFQLCFRLYILEIYLAEKRLKRIGPICETDSVRVGCLVMYIIPYAEVSLRGNDGFPGRAIVIGKRSGEEDYSSPE